MRNKIITAQQAVDLIPDGATLMMGGFVGCAVRSRRIRCNGRGLLFSRGAQCARRGAQRADLPPGGDDGGAVLFPRTARDARKPAQPLRADQNAQRRQHEAERAHPGGRPQKDEQQHARREQTDGDGEQPEQGEEGVGGEVVFCAAARVPRQL